MAKKPNTIKLAKIKKDEEKKAEQKNLVLPKLVFGKRFMRVRRTPGDHSVDTKEVSLNHSAGRTELLKLKLSNVILSSTDSLEKETLVATWMSPGEEVSSLLRILASDRPIVENPVKPSLGCKELNFNGQLSRIIGGYLASVLVRKWEQVQNKLMSC